MAFVSSPPFPERRFHHHVDFLARLYLVWGAFNAIVGVATAWFAASAALLSRAAGEVRAGADIAATVTAGAFLLVAATALLWAGVHAWCGRALLRHDRWGRLLGLALAGFNALLFPLGTALAAYALWVLFQEEVRQLFEVAAE
jgi:hypothetical protein